MGLFSRKPKVDEREAVRLSIGEAAHRVNEKWPEVSTLLVRPVIPETLRQMPDVLDRPATKSVFFLAALACDAHALLNLLPKEQATRLGVYTRMGLAVMLEMDQWSLATFDRFDRVWTDAEAGSHDPIEVLGDALYDLVGCTDTMLVGDRTCVSRVATAGLGGAAILLTGWWKVFLSKYDLTA